MISLLAAVHGGDVAVFAVGAVLASAGALAIVLGRSAMQATAGFAVTVFGIAVLFVNQNATFLAAVEVLLGIGAVAALFAFVAMYVGADRAGRITKERVRAQRPLAVLFGLALFVLLLALVDWSFSHTGAPSQAGALGTAGTDVRVIAEFLFANYGVALIAISAAAIVAALAGVLWTTTEKAGELPPSTTKSEVTQ